MRWGTAFHSAVYETLSSTACSHLAQAPCFRIATALLVRSFSTASHTWNPPVSCCSKVMYLCQYLLFLELPLPLRLGASAMTPQHHSLCCLPHIACPDFDVCLEQFLVRRFLVLKYLPCQGHPELFIRAAEGKLHFVALSIQGNVS